MAPSVDPSMQSTGNIGQMQKLYQRIAREVATLRDNLEYLEKKELFLRSEMLLHQASLLANEAENGVIISNKTKLMLKSEHVEALKKMLNVNKRMSIMNISEAKQTVEQVEGLEENVNFDANALTPTQSATGSRGIIKKLHVEGSISDISCNIECESNHTLVSRGGGIDKVQLLNVNPLPLSTQEMFKSPNALDRMHIDMTLNSLYYCQMLEEERRECIYNLKEDIPDLSINEDTEPLELEFHPTREQSIIIRWGIKFDSKSYRLMYDIQLSCSEDEMAYYSQNKIIFSYLRGTRKLESSEDILEFFNLFG